MTETFTYKRRFTDNVLSVIPCETNTDEPKYPIPRPIFRKAQSRRVKREAI